MGENWWIKKVKQEFKETKIDIKKVNMKYAKVKNSEELFGKRDTNLDIFELLEDLFYSVKW